MKKRVLIFGATGMVGHTIAIYLIERGYDVTVCNRHNFPFCENIAVDIYDIPGLKAIIEKENYDVMINCIGVLNEECEKNKSNAVYVNSFFPHFLSDITRDISTRLIHLSTDCVFSGINGPYYEDSLCDSHTFYGKTKALGECVDNKNLTFRNSIIGADINESGKGLFNWFMKQRGSICGYSRVMWTGVSSFTFARAVEAAIEQEITGLYHLVNNEIISKYDLLILFKEAFGKNIDIKPDENPKTEKILINTRKDFIFSIPTYREMVQEMRQWISIHSEIYKHYSL